MFEDDEKENNNKKRNGAESPEGGEGGKDRPPKGVDYKSSRYLFVIILAGIVMALFFGTKSFNSGGSEQMNWSEFRQELRAQKFKSITINGREVRAKYNEMLVPEKTAERPAPKTEVHAYAPDPFVDSGAGCEYQFVLSCAESAKTKVVIEPPISPWQAVMWTLLPWLVIMVVIYFVVFRQLKGPGGPGGVLSFGKSRATLITKDKMKKTFKDVAGVEEAKAEVEEIVGFLKNPKKFQRLGGRIPKGILLIGAPGTGKTLLAKSIAGEADVPFYSISGSDFVEMFVGVGASRVRDLFLQARESSPCIIFLDEIDAVGRRRGTGIGGGHDEREQTLNEILVQMDGMESDDKIIVMAATNRPDVLDPALLRPGRFDRHVYVDLPDVKGREEILRVHTKKVKLAAEVDLSQLAKSTAGTSGADLENIINEAALIAVMKDKDGIEMSDLDEARDKVAWGREKRSRVMDEAERWVTSYHETGHALVSYYLPECDKPTKVSVIPRGRALGITVSNPLKDVYSLSRTQLLGRIKMCYGGRVAEEMFTGDITTGAQSDIEQASKLVRRMICEWGMSDRLGPILFTEQGDDVFLGHDMSKSKSLAESTMVTIDSEVRRIVQECYDDVKRVLEEHRSEIELVAKALMEHEVLNGEEIDALLKTGKLEKRIPAKQVVFRPLPKTQVNEKKSEPESSSMSGATPTPQPA